MEFIITIQEPEIQLITVASQGEQGIQGVPGTTVHNDTTGKQGGSVDEFYHLTEDQNAAAENANGPDSDNPFATVDDLKPSPIPSALTYLMNGSTDESYSLTGCTQSDDLVNFWVGDRAIKLTMPGAGVATIRRDPPGADDPLIITPAPSTIGLAVYIPDASLISLVSMELYSDVGLSQVWSRSDANFHEPLHDGWNVLRFGGHSSVLTDWGTIYRIRIVLATTAATTLTIGGLWAEQNQKAKILFIEDGGFTTFLNVGYPDLKARGVPVTWAVDPALVGAGSGDAERISEADIASVSDENSNSIGFHAYFGTPTENMTADEIIEDTVLAQKWLSRRGYTGGMWRAAFSQNLATNASAAEPYVLALATGQGSSNVVSWPPENRFNISRVALQGMTESEVDALFTLLETTHETLFIYTHGISETSVFDTTPTEWAYFLGKLDAATAAGGLEAVTFESLYKRTGGAVETGFLGSRVARYMDESGAMVQQQII